MKSNYNQLGQYIEMVSRTNSDLKYGIEDVRGCSNTKQMMQTRANLIGRTYEKFIVLRPQEFVFNRRTTRNGEKIGMAYNNTDREYIFTNDYVAFRVKQEYLDKLLPDYLYLFFCRDEFDRYARYKSTGSATEFFNWEDMYAVPFEIPPMDFQQLIVNAYKVLNERIETKQKINDNLAAQCSCIMYEQYCSDIKNGNPWIKYTVQELIDKKFIDSPMDGNHGELHPKVSDYVTTGIPFVMANNLSNGFVDLTQCAFITEKQAKTLRKGFARPDDVLLTHKATLGRTAIVPKGYEYIILTPQVTYYRVHKGLSNVYLRYYFESSYFQSTLEAFAGGGSTRAYIGITKQCDLPIYLPCESSMTILTYTLSKIEQVRVLNQMEIQQLIDVRNTLITQLSSR